MNNSSDTLWTLIFALAFGISAIASLTLIEHQEWLSVRPTSGAEISAPKTSALPTN